MKNQPPMKWEALTNDFIPGSSVKDYIATQALYAIDSTLPLHQLFPPDFRRLWMSWENQKMNEKNQVKQEQHVAKQQWIDHLVSLIGQQSSSDRIIESTITPTCDVNEINDTDENWDDADDVNVTAKPIASVTELTPTGKKLQRDFISRQSTASYIKMKATRDNLPMASYREQILDTIRKNAVTILAAETGAGKTTQCKKADFLFVFPPWQLLTRCSPRPSISFGRGPIGRVWR
jgi:hypothetical protein